MAWGIVGEVMVKTDTAHVFSTGVRGWLVELAEKSKASGSVHLLSGGLAHLAVIEDWEWAASEGLNRDSTNWWTASV